MRTIRTKIYKFDELNDKAKQKVIDQHSDINVSYNWWEGVYDDAKEIGLKIEEFDLDRADYCHGNFILAANEVAQNIFNNHGEVCNTYKTAEKFMGEWQPVFNEYIQKEGTQLEEKLMDIEKDFLTNLLEDYKKMLKEDYEYQISDEAIIETILANDYEFTADGIIF